MQAPSTTKLIHTTIYDAFANLRNNRVDSVSEAFPYFSMIYQRIAGGSPVVSSDLSFQATSGHPTSGSMLLYPLALERAMQIIRPYGSSRSKQGQEGLRRVLVEKTAERAERDVPTFALTHDELVIAQSPARIWSISSSTSRRPPQAKCGSRAGTKAIGNRRANKPTTSTSSLCDVVILAFCEYLSEQKLDWILLLKADQPLTAETVFSLDGLQTAMTPVEDADDWQVALYLLLHLLPVDAVAKLLHQLFRWDITAAREGRLPADESQRLHRLFAAMTLYLDMHDAKHEGGSPLAEYAEVQELFETTQGYGRVFPNAVVVEADRKIPKRGLREILRFGHLPLVKAIAGGRRIEDARIDRVFSYEAAPDGGGPPTIVALQQRREELHERWVRRKYLDQSDLREYCEGVSKISEHRQDSNFINLVDHVRAHRTILAALGRLVDYVGLFERDLYFTTLALINLHGGRPEAFFEERGLRLLHNGQIIFALRRLRDGSTKVAAIKGELARHFTEVWADQNVAKNIRNDLAHLNMLQGAQPDPRLTHWTNQTRQLMGYDRELKNAVSKSVIDLSDREGIELKWVMRIERGAHDLTDATLTARRARHLGGKHLTLIGEGSSSRSRLPFEESLHSFAFVAMIATSFDGKARAEQRGLLPHNGALP